MSNESLVQVWLYSANLGEVARRLGVSPDDALRAIHKLRQRGRVLPRLPGIPCRLRITRPVEGGFWSGEEGYPISFLVGTLVTVGPGSDTADDCTVFTCDGGSLALPDGSWELAD
jgi:hypothetical protein